MKELALALRLLWRDHRAGELALIAVAMLVAVASVTTVGFFTDRIHQALGRQANNLLGADLVIAGNQPIDAAFEAAARERGLAIARFARFPSMVTHSDKNLLASVKAVSAGYPLRGELRVSDTLYGAERRVDQPPERGTAWIDERLATELKLRPGDRVELGRSMFAVAAFVTREPDVSIGFINSGPRIIIGEADVAATGLIQPGSRISYRLLVAGAPQAVDAYRAHVSPRLLKGQRIEGVKDARPEIRSALERAEKFLSLSALVSVVLAAVAVGLSARRFLQRHLDAVAIMRCLGASQAKVLRLYVVHFALLGVIASAIGCVVGAVAQSLLAYWLGTLVKVELPPPGVLPAVHGLLTGIVLLLGFALPPLVSLKRVPTLRVLRRDLGVPAASGLLVYGVGYAAIALLILWKAESVRLGSVVLGGFTAAMLGVGLFTWLLVRLVGAVRVRAVAWRYGVGNLRRRALGSVLQVVALGLGMMALLVLTLVRHDLVRAWQTTLPPEAPNRFVVNIQATEVPRIKAFFEAHRVPAPAMFPMVRGRLVKIGERSVSAADYQDERARRLIDREFNLSWAERMQADNRIVAGAWWPAAQPPAQFSVEQGLADSLGIRMGDVLTFDVAGTPVSARVTSLRHVDWDTFNVNFFVIASPGVLDSQPATFVTSFYLAPGNSALIAALVREFPGVILIDVAQVLGQVQTMMDQVSRAVQFIFLFTLLAGLTVLYAAIASTQDERVYQATIMRTLGASRAQLTRAIVAEFAVLGLLAGVLAAAGATALAYVVATRILNLPFSASALVWITGATAGAIGIALAGYAGTRRVLDAPPLKAMREAG
ncbi:MAG TPA: FtsX-like permease family protein [Burkholderiales bacterium]|nr:FtsX-like permease family protein [Burkholderiales bacterium]